MSYSPAWASSSLICPRSRTGWCASTTNAEKQSSTSRQESMPSAGHGCSASGSGTGPAAPACAGLQLGHVLALHRVARGDGRLVADQPPAQVDLDRGPHRAPRPHHHLSTGRGRDDRPDGARHPRRHPTIASATAMRMTAIRTQTERKPQDRSVRRAAKRAADAG